MKIHQSKPKFEITDNKIVTCTLHATVEFDSLPQLKINKVQGVAKCNPEDEFIQKRGEIIAESRASRKLYRMVELYLKRMVDQLDAVRESAGGEWIRARDLIAREDNHINDLIHG